ncbi:diphthine--ammonia ligase [Neobacillus citreus]|uniref:Diphthine--ammonia ligase n=1 Tax=Neobacillus citreus TaxID=2833578 RepID=A0A942SUY7_9BACI|nr:diphthine--ammonia ligase [Neobacillus citreus]
MAKKRAALSFSGKDSTLALHELLHGEEYEVELLFTTVTEGFNRTSIHGVREELLEAQAASIGIPLRKIFIPEQCSNEVYGEIMNRELADLKANGIDHIVFGDLFLEDIRKYREEQLKPLGFTAVFPLWGQNTADLIHRFLSLGYQTIITCVDLTKLPENFSGKEINDVFMEVLPEGVDPCGENGEYHSFVYDGPIFNKPIRFQVGEKKFSKDVYTGETRFCFTDLIPLREF